jgi:hypothetical protein
MWIFYKGSGDPIHEEEEEGGNGRHTDRGGSELFAQWLMLIGLENHATSVLLSDFLPLPD